jgi:hypothetical protein
VERHRLGGAILGHTQPAGVKKTLQVDRVMDDLERPAELAVLVRDRVEAVWAGGDDRSVAHAVSVEGVDVAGGEDLEDVVVAHPSRRVTRTRLLLAEDREPHPRSVQA